MRNYLNRLDREHHLMLLIVWDYFTTWMEKTSCLSPEERKRLKTACTHLIKTSDSILRRLEPDYARKLVKDVRNIEIRIVDKVNKKFSGVQGVINIEVDDLYDIASYALVDCIGCKEKNFKECEKYKLYMKLNIPVAQEETDGCPYEN